MKAWGRTLRDWRRDRRNGWLGTATVLATTATLLGPVSAQAVDAAHPGYLHQKWSPPHTALPHTPSVRPVSAPQGGAPKPHYKIPGNWKGPSGGGFVSGSAELSLPQGQQEKGRPKLQAGHLPVWVGQASQTAKDNSAGSRGSNVPSADAGTQIEVGVVDATKARAAGAQGLVATLSRASAGPSARVEVGIDVRQLDASYGADAASRSRLIALPACSLSTPKVSGCLKPTAVASHLDIATGQLIADVALSASAPKQSAAKSTDAAPAAQPLVLATQTTPRGGGGSYAATSLAPSGAWTAGAGSGGFTYNYPIQVPPSLGADAPKIALDYDSSSVDGRTSSTNAQSSWIGDGWDYSPGFVERSYKSCDQDGLQYSGDACWGGYNAILSLGGHSSQLVRDDTSGVWRLKQDDGSKVEFLAGASNGTSSGEYIKVSTTDGSVYYFGLNHLPGGDKTDQASNSAWTEPVYSPNKADPCYDSTKGNTSWCQMGYRFNLDYAVDPHGNLTTYTYATQSNYYTRGGGQNPGAGTLTSYIRNGALTSVAYGQRLADQVTAKGKLLPAAKVTFTTAPEGRCSTEGGFTCIGATLSSSNAGHWPDVPYDQNCASTGSCTNYGPSFWSNNRLASITTQVLSNGTYKTVDTYALTHSYPDPADGTKPTMWLATIRRTGQDGTATSQTPPVSFTPAELPNRVDGTDLVPVPPIFNRPRIQTITTEMGKQIQVDYGLPACSRVKKVMPASADTDTMNCYNVKWYPPGSVYGADPASDWFNRYTVNSVTENDPVAHSASVVTKYAYGPTAWHYDTNELTDPKTRTWNEFRGFASVTVTTGNGQDGPVAQSVTKYLQGMDGDTLPGGGTRSVKVDTSLGDQVVDSDWLAGQALESDTYDKAGGSVTASSVTTTTGPTTTATHARGSALPNLVARYSASTIVNTAKALKADGTMRTTTTTTLTDPDHANRTKSIYTSAEGQPDQCVLTSYATSSNSLMTGLADETKTLTGSNACTATATKDNTASDVRTLYDNLAFGQAGTTGDATTAQALDHYDTAGNPVFVTTATTTYDAYGRTTSVTDPNTTDKQHPNGATTSTVFTPAKTGELPAKVSITSPAPGSTTDWTSTSTIDVGRNSVLTSTDLNGKTTTRAYDPLGRLISVWAPGRLTSQHANATFSYAINGSTAPSTVTSATLDNDDAHYNKSTVIYDGFGRARQTQATPGLSAYTGRVISDTLYDSHGWAVESRGPYYDATTAPGTSLFNTTDNQVPSQVTTIHDGLGRATASVFSSYAVEQSRTTSTYPGVDETDVTPPTGGSPTTNITDGLGRTSQVWQYKTPTATGKSGDADVTTYTYTPAGKPDTRTDATGKNHWSYTYDLRGHQTSTTDPDTGTTTLTYDSDGRLATTTDARKQTLSYDYDLIGRKTAAYSTTAPSTTRVPLTAWTYDSISNAKGQPVKSTRYADGKTDAAYSSEITGYDGSYHPTGTTVTIPASEGKLAGTYTTTATYDPITGALNESVTGARGDIPAETLDYTYDVNGPLDTFGSYATTYDLSTDYDAFGRAIRTTVNPYGTQIVATDNYDQATGNLLSSWIDKQTATSGAVQQTTYSRNPAGQVTAVQNIPDNTPAQADLQCFSYDYLGRLTTAWTDTGGTTAKAQPSVANIGGCNNTSPTSGSTNGKTTVGGPAAYWTSYDYDITGNRKTLTQHDVSDDTTKDVTTTQTFAPAGQANQPTTDANTGGGTGGAHALLSTTSSGPGNPGASSYQYDATGNTTAITTTAGTTSLTWNAEGKLASTTATGDTGNTSYVYDASGNQLIRRDPNKTTLSIGADELTLDAATNTVHDTRTYAMPNGITAIRTAAGLAWQIADSSGTATLALDYKTLAETRRPADPFGNPRGTQPSAWAGDHGFVGGTQNTATGLTHLGAREYQPSTGRFISADPILDAAQPQQWNAYAYSNNNPTNLSDPTGLRPDGSCGGAGYCNVGTASKPRAETWTYEGDGDWSWGWSGNSTQTWSEGDTSYTVTSYVHYNQRRGYSFDQSNVQAAPVKRDVTSHGYGMGTNPNYDPNVSDDWIQRPPLNTWQKVAIGVAAVLGTAGAIAPLAPVLLDGAADLGLACLRNPAKCAEITGETLTGGAAGGSLPEASAAGTARAEQAAKTDLEDLIASACKNSFPGTTPVVTAAGIPKPIEDIKVGDTVQATNPLTGVTQPQKVTAVIKTLTDTGFTDTTISTPDGPRTLTSTQHHPYWSETRHRWTNATDLRPGEELRSPNGRTQRITRVRDYTAHIVTYNLTVANLHTYYVLAGTTPVLVHNSNGGYCGTPAGVASAYRADAANGVGTRRNVAVAQYEIDGESGQLIGVSGEHPNPGSVGIPSNPMFNPGARTSDSEWQVLENLGAKLSPGARGNINLFSDRPVCPSCQSVIQQFQERFPGVSINVTTG
ncbi:RHS repeat-associated core domain-containing protein [Streptomyces xanthochromogenes]|uniref:RHS repeat-associated core domain-containing protein n=1 Tax=Streptomyces xanthochromogenes TaxID=67384 RepID=UPI003828D274